MSRQRHFRNAHKYYKRKLGLGSVMFDALKDYKELRVVDEYNSQSYESHGQMVLHEGDGLSC